MRKYGSMSPRSLPLLAAAAAAIAVCAAGDSRAAAGAAPVPPAESPAAAPGVIRALEALPEPDLRAVRLRAHVVTTWLMQPGTLSLTIGARGTVSRLQPGGDPSGTLIERVVYPTKVKPWTPDRPVLYQLEATVDTPGRAQERRLARFPMRRVEVREGTVYLNGSRLRIRGADGVPAAGLEGNLAFLRTQGYNLVRLGDAAAVTGSRESCAAAGLLVLEDLPGPPSLVPVRIAAAPEPDDAGLEAHGLLAPFGSATAFAAACARRQADRGRRELEDLRFDTASPGFIVSGWRHLGDAAARAHAPWVIAARLARQFVQPGASPLVTLMVGGPARLPGDAVVEWRLVEPVSCADFSRTAGGSGAPRPASWRAAPRSVSASAASFGGTADASAASAAFSLPPVNRGGRWWFEARVRRGSRIVAEAREVFSVAPDPSGSQVSFALIGEAPGIERAFGSWIIPADFADVTVVVHPARIPPEAFASARRRLAAGKKLLVMAADADDIASLNAAGILPWTLSPAGGASPEGVRWFRPGPFVHRPAAGPGETPRWLADDGDEAFAPVLSLVPPPGATVWAGSVEGAAWGADILTAPAGPGSVVFCQWRLAEHIDQPLARIMFLRLLAP